MEELKEELTPVKYNESWVVRVDKEDFVLNSNQVKTLKEASVRGNRGIIWYKNFAISIPHIKFIEKVTKQTNNLMVEVPSAKLSKNEREKLKSLLFEAREKVGI